MSEFQSAQLEPKPLQPETSFTHKGQPASFSVLDFWVWIASDVLNNTLRGMVAEYIVSQATGACLAGTGTKFASSATSLNRLA